MIREKIKKYQKKCWQIGKDLVIYNHTKQQTKPTATFQKGFFHNKLFSIKRREIFIWRMGEEVRKVERFLIKNR